MSDGPYRESPRPWGDMTAMTHETVPRWLWEHRVRDPHVAVVVSAAIQGRWTEAQMLRELVTVLVSAKSEYQEMAEKLAANQVAPVFIPGTIPGPGDDEGKS